MLHQRAQFVPSNSTGSRLSVVAGRTGTRCNSGRPQTRWEDGLKLANEVLKTRATSLKGNNAVSIGTRIREAFLELSDSLQALYAQNHTWLFKWEASYLMALMHTVEWPTSETAANALWKWKWISMVDKVESMLTGSVDSKWLQGEVHQCIHQNKWNVAICWIHLLLSQHWVGQYLW